MTASRPTDTAIDMEAILAPFDADRGVGVDLRRDPLITAIIEARRDEDARLSQGVWTHDVKRADWRLVERLCIEALCTRSKDLQVGCWLAEALVRGRGFAGLAVGMRVLSGLCRRYWADIYPTPDDDDLTPRLAPFEWLNDRLPVALRSLAIVEARGDSAAAYSWTDYANARRLEAIRQRDPKSVERSEASGAVTLAAFNAARDRTDYAFWRALSAMLNEGRTALAGLNVALEEHCGREAPSLAGIDRAIGELLGLVLVAASSRSPRPVAASPAPAPRAAAAPPVSAEPPPLRTREDAYAQLAEIAEFLKQLEPHSPVPYLLQSAIEWSHLSLADLMVMFADAGFDLSDVLALLSLSESIEGVDSRGDDSAE